MEIDKSNYLAAEEEQEINIKDVLLKYMYHWRWFALSIIVCSVICFFYLRYQTPIYEVKASILIKDDKKGSMMSELSAFEDLGILKSSSNIDNEIEILKSRTLMTRVVNELHLNVSYFSTEAPLERELFTETPYTLSLLTSPEVEASLKASWIINANDNTTFDLFDDNKVLVGHYKFGEAFTLPFGKLLIATTPYFTNLNVHQPFRIIVSPIDKVVDSYIKSLKIEPVNKNANVLNLSLQSPIAEKAAKIINNLIKQHTLDAIADKNQVSKNTASFINERITFITQELGIVETEAEDFKTKNKLTDVESEAKLFLETGSQSELSILEVNTQRALADYMFDYVNTHQNAEDLIPANLGINDLQVGTQISDYNKAVLERNRLLKHSSDKNPVIENLEGLLSGLRKSVKESLNNYKNSLAIKLKELSKQENGINSKIASVPKYEREYRAIQRQQQIKESLYLYLLQKREETNIALAVTVANAKVIDAAYSDDLPVSPKKKMIFGIALLLGLIIPVVALYIRDLLDSKVRGKQDLEKLNMPFLGDLPLIDEANKIIAKEDSSSVAEAFRLLRTNVDFLLGAKSNQSKVVFITSTIAKEGKSFVAVNLANMIAYSGKKVLLVGMDLRVPKVLKYMGLEERTGLSNYLSDSSLNLEELIFNTPNNPSLDILASGDIPPNPAELLMNARVEELFAKLKEQYDYIIVDTAPIGLVTDTFLLGKYADAFIYIVRAHFLEKHSLAVVENVFKERKLPNMAILINGADAKKGYGYSGYGYKGYGYKGYGYGHLNDKKKRFWQR